MDKSLSVGEKTRYCLEIIGSLFFVTIFDNRNISPPNEKPNTHINAESSFLITTNDNSTSVIKNKKKKLNSTGIWIWIVAIAFIKDLEKFFFFASPE